MDVKLSIGGADVGMNESIKEEVRKDEGGDSMELLEDEMDSLVEEEIWNSLRERMNNALAAAQAVEGQDPAKAYADARKLADVIEGADVEEFISEIERLANQTDLSAIFNFSGLWSGSLLHVAAAANKDDILRLLLDHVSDDLIAAQNEWEDTPLHMAAKAGGSRAAMMLIRRAKDLANVAGNIRFLRMKNEHGNTALHEAVLNGHFDMVRLLLREDLEPVYWKNLAGKSPLHLALDTDNSAIHEVLFSRSLEPSRIEGIPPVHGAVVRDNYGLVANILQWNKKLFAMTDCEKHNVFHIAAYFGRSQVFDILRPEIEYLARERDIIGDLPIHIAAKKGDVEQIKKLHLVSQLPDGRGRTVLHVAAKYGRVSAVRYILRHPELGKHINAVDHAGNTPLHLSVMHSQHRALAHLLLDNRIQVTVTNNKCLTAFNIAEECIARKHGYRNELVYRLLKGHPIQKGRALDGDSLIHRPKALDKKFVCSGRNIPSRDIVSDLINSRMVVATLVATVTFAAGFAVPGGFNGSDTASKDDRGMATMLDNRQFQVFVIFNTFAMFSSIVALSILIWGRLDEVGNAVVAYERTTLPLQLAIMAMSVAFYTGVALTVSKLPWLAYIINLMGSLFLFYSVSKMSTSTRFFIIFSIPIRRRTVLLAFAYINLLADDTSIDDDAEEDGTTSETSASRPTDGAGQSKTDDSATEKCGDAPHPPSH